MKTQSLGRALLIAASVLIVATITCVIALTPSPAEHRLVQRDAAVLSDLEQLGNAVELWQREHGQLPPDLVPVVAQPGVALQLAPADGGPAYVYRPIDARRYQLCAHFLTDTADKRFGRPYPADRAHPAGQHCFTHQAPAIAAATATVSEAADVAGDAAAIATDATAVAQ